MKAHEATKYMTPDQIAETVEGIGPNTYRELWHSLEYVEQPSQSEIEGGMTSGDYAQICNTAQVWDRLSPEAQREINEALTAQDRAWGLS